MTRIAFFGSPPFAATVLEALVASGHQVTVAITRADRRRSRGGAPVGTAVKEAAERLGVPTSFEPDAAAGSSAELGVVVAYGRLIRRPLLDRLVLVNLHLSLLPRWRGAAPVERAILAGDAVTGVCLMRIDEGLDTGPVYGCAEVPVGEDSAAELTERLVAAGIPLLLDRLAGGLDTLGQPEPQRGEPTYAAKLEPDERRLDWTRPAEQLARVVRVGRAWTTREGARLLVHSARAHPDRGPRGEPGSVSLTAGGVVEVATGGGVLELVQVQVEGRPPRLAADWARGARLDGSSVLGR